MKRLCNTIIDGTASAFKAGKRHVVIMQSWKKSLDHDIQYECYLRRQKTCLEVHVKGLIEISQISYITVGCLGAGPVHRSSTLHPLMSCPELRWIRDILSAQAALAQSQTESFNAMADQSTHDCGLQSSSAVSLSQESKINVTIFLVIFSSATFIIKMLFYFVLLSHKTTRGKKNNPHIKVFIIFIFCKRTVFFISTILENNAFSFFILDVEIFLITV